MLDKDKKYSESELKEYIAALRKKDRDDAEAKEILQKEPVHKSADNLKRIGELIVDRSRAGKKPSKNIDKVTEKAFGEAVDYIESNENNMEDSNDEQKRIYGRVKETLVSVRSSTSFEELEANRKKIEALQKINDSVKVDGNNQGELEARDFIEKLLNKILANSKPSKMADVLGVAKKGLLSQEGTAIGAVLKEFKFIGEMLKISRQKSVGDAESYEKEIERLSRIEALPASHYKKPKQTTAQEELPIAKEIDPGIVAKKADIGETAVDPAGKMYEKTGTGWKDLETGKVVKRHKQAAIENLYSQNRPSVKPSATGTNKVSTMTVDKIVAKSIVLEKPDKKAAPVGRVENKPFNANLLGEEPAESKADGSVSLLDRIKDVLGGGVLGAGAKKAIGGLGTAAKSVMRSPIGATALAGGAMLAGGAALDTGLGALGVGKDDKGESLVLDEAQDKANWEKMSTWEKIQSGAARGIEKAGKFVFLDNMANQAASERIAKETDYLKDRITPKATMVERSAQEIPKSTERVEAKARELGSVPVIVNQSTPAPEQPAPSIIPIRGSIRPNESSFRRFQDRNFKS